MTIVQSTSEDYEALKRGRAPRIFELPDTPVSTPATLQMLADVAMRVRETFSPASWLIVEANEIVGLCCVTRPPTDGSIDIGYGIAPSRRGRGIAGPAIRDIIAWARTDPDVQAVTAETSPTNLPSQKVLERNGFSKVGERIDDEDGALICWRCPTVCP